MFRRLLPLALAALLAAATAPARADDLATVRAKVAAAMMATKSFVVTTTATTGFTVTLTFVAPDRYHSALAYGGGTRDIVLVGPVAYVSADGGKSYRKTDTPPSVVAAQSQLRDVPVDQVLPDAVSGGKTWGRFATTAAGPEKDQHLICTYDKKTYRVNDCSNEGFTLVFSRYDDPANVVAVPTNLATPSPAAH
ncbi:MAG TPA: hypothetical protein VGX96_10060 [Candidatus Elarobacter sp.]|jgi:hypothetical protein|nr:hypothetical protein [Candidatus Elarobacter sp.]